MQNLQFLNQIYTLFNMIYYIPYTLYWLSGFAFNMYWLYCMFIIVYNSNIYNNVRNQKYFDCLSIVGLELYYLYGVLSWNPLIISILMFHSIIIGNKPYKLIYDLFREFKEFDVIMNVNTNTDQEEETVTEQEEETVTEQEDAVDTTPIVIAVTEEKHAMEQ